MQIRFKDSFGIHMDQQLTSFQLFHLQKPFIMLEIPNALFQMHPNKNLRLGGFSLDFFRSIETLWVEILLQ